jgi:hypothetical protein
MTNPQPHPADISLSTGPERVQPNALHTPAPVHTDSLLLEEIRVLRERGLSDECIHGLFSGFNIEASPEPSGPHWKLPINDQLIRLIWGKPLPTSLHAD